MKSVGSIAFLFSAAAVLTMTLMLMFTASNANHSYCTERTSQCVSTHLTEASKSVVLIHLDNFHAGGTGTLIGRVRVDDDTWRYRILTAYHVMESIFDALKSNGQFISKKDFDSIKSITIGNRNGFHSKIELYSTSLNSVDIAVPTQDWVVFNVDIDAKLPCAELGTRSEFDNVLPFENVYGMGADRLKGIFTRDGYISSIDCVEPFNIHVDIDAPWSVSPEMFFRPFHYIYRGASGGPIFNKSGKIIGIYIAVGVDRISPFAVEELNGMAIALKVFLVQEAIANTNSKITIVEE